jgi:uncharacterized membrane protein (TIGR02234 family)
MSATRREFGLVLLLGAVGAGLVVFAVRQTWAQAIFTPPRPLPAQQISVTGQQLVPLASALGLAALACLAAVIATRSVARRVAGAVLAALGAGAAVAAGAGVQASGVLATAQADAASGALGGSTTGGTSPGGASHAIVIAGSAGRAVMTGAPWRAAAIAAAVVVVLAGLAAVWRGPRWPVMSARFERPDRRPDQRPDQRQGQRPAPRATDSATLWESLSRDLDPTVEEDQVGGGPPHPA